MTQESTTNARETRKSPRGDARRRDILDAAVRLFANGGYNAASLANIAEEVGISQAGLLHHFPSKSELLLAVIRARDDELITNDRFRGEISLMQLMAVLTENEASPAIVKLNAILTIESLLEDHPAREWGEQTYALRRAAYIEVFERTLDADRMPPGVTPHDVGVLFLALNEGVRYEWIREGEGFHRASRLSEFFVLMRPYFRDSAQLDELLETYFAAPE